MRSQDTKGASGLSTALSGSPARVWGGVSAASGARSAPRVLRMEEAAIRCALRKPPHEVAVPVLAEGHEHPEPDAEIRRHSIGHGPEPVEHLELVPVGGEPEL